MVAHDEDLEVRVGLRQHRGQGALDQDLGAVVGGDAHRDEGRAAGREPLGRRRIVPCLGKERPVLMNDRDFPEPQVGTPVATIAPAQLDQQVLPRRGAFSR